MSQQGSKRKLSGVLKSGSGHRRMMQYPASRNYRLPVIAHIRNLNIPFRQRYTPFGTFTYLERCSVRSAVAGLHGKIHCGCDNRSTVATAWISAECKREYLNELNTGIETTQKVLIITMSEKKTCHRREKPKEKRKTFRLTMQKNPKRPSRTHRTNRIKIYGHSRNVPKIRYFRVNNYRARV